jgi:MFS family permease
LKQESISDEGAWPGTAHAWWAVILLSAAYLLSFVDRTVINLLVQPIERDLQISDTQFGALQGVAFGLFYILAALPLGRLADSYSRRGIIAGGLAVFTAFSMASGLARSYSSLFVARMGVGAGEASLLPAGYSILSDSFPPERLGRAISVFTIGAFLGVGLSYIWGGTVIGWFGDVEELTVPVFGSLRSWQLAFIIVALPGLLLVPLMFTVREPRRRGLRKLANRNVLPARAVMREIWLRRKALGPLLAGFAIVTLSGQASAVWTVAVFLRSFDMPPQEIGPVYGLVYIASAIPGAVAGGWLCDRWTARGLVDAPLKVAAYGFIGTGVFGGLAPLMPSAGLALWMFAPAIALQSMMYPLAGTAIQLMLPNRLRGQVSALYLVVINVVGLGLGPPIIGLMTDYMFTEPADVRYALALVNGACAPIAVILLLLTFGPYREERAKMSPLADK